MLKIPFSGDSEKTKPLLRCIQKAAREMQMSEYAVALVCSHFLEELSHQVAENKLVSIPCFGVFGLKAWQPRHKADMPGYCYPAFSGAVPFRNMARLMGSPSQAAFNEAIDKHRRHSHPSSRKDRSGRMPWSAQAAFRERVRAQAKRYGYDV